MRKTKFGKRKLRRKFAGAESTLGCRANGGNEGQKKKSKRFFFPGTKTSTEMPTPCFP
jgi:ribosomal protein L15